MLHIPTGALAEIATNAPGLLEEIATAEARKIELASLKNLAHVLWHWPGTEMGSPVATAAGRMSTFEVQEYRQNIQPRDAIEGFFSRIEADCDLKTKFIDSASRGNFISAGRTLTCLNSLEPQNSFTVQDHNTLLQHFAEAYWEVYFKEITGQAAPTIVLRDVSDSKTNDRPIPPQYTYDPAQNTLHLTKVPYDHFFEPLTLVIAGLLRKAANHLPGLISAESLEPQEGGRGVLTRDEREHTIATENAKHFLERLNREAVAGLISRMSDQDLCDLKPNQRAYLVEALSHSQRQLDYPSISDYTDSELEQAGRLMRTCPQDQSFRRVFDTASEIFLGTNPLEKLRNWVRTPREQQEQLVTTILNGMEEAWNKATGGSHHLFSEKNKPGIRFNSDGTTGRAREENLNLIRSQWEHTSYNRCLQHFAKSTDAHAPRMYEYVDRTRPRGEILFIPYSDENWIWKHPNAQNVLNEIARVHLQSVRYRILRTALSKNSEHRLDVGPEDPFYSIYWRLGGGRFNPNDMGPDLSKLLHKFASPARAHMNELTRPDEQVPSKVASLIEHPYYTQPKLFATPRGVASQPVSGR